MKPRSLVIIGGGEHARVVAEAARTRPDQWTLIGFTDPDPAVRRDAPSKLQLPSLGDDEDLASAGNALRPLERPDLVLGFGRPPASRRATVSAFGPTARWATIVHVAAWVSTSANVEPGAVVLAGAVVNAGAVVGAHAIVNTHVVVEHDVTVGEYAHLAPGAIVGGGSRIGSGVLVGLGAVIRDHVVIGRDATIGMGAVVIADVAFGLTVVGVPGREHVGPDG